MAGVLERGGTVLPGLRDHHVHLGLVDRGALAGSVLSGVDDLGWSLDRALDWARFGVGGLHVHVTGPFLTAPGGYPSGRSWAPPGTVEVIDSPAGAVEIVDRLATAGVDLIKVVLHTGMPLLGDHELAAVVVAAHRRGRRVVVHAEGTGQTARALDAGVDVLAHTPWTERLSDDLVAALARRMIMISSLAIHSDDAESYAVALDNLARFHAAGGEVRYGTDLGNGSRPPGLDCAEIAGLAAAGLGVEAIMTAIAVVAEHPDWLTWSPHPLPGSVTGLVDWFHSVQRIPREAAR